jgi:hypothetical protein
MLLEHYEVKHNLTRSRVWNYKPYPALEEVVMPHLPVWSVMCY